jgi:hypothetical protein
MDLKDEHGAAAAAGVVDSRTEEAAACHVINLTDMAVLYQVDADSETVSWQAIPGFGVAYPPGLPDAVMQHPHADFQEFVEERIRIETILQKGWESNPGCYFEPTQIEKIYPPYDDNKFTTIVLLGGEICFETNMTPKQILKATPPKYLAHIMQVIAESRAELNGDAPPGLESPS